MTNQRRLGVDRARARHIGQSTHQVVATDENAVRIATGCVRQNGGGSWLALAIHRELIGEYATRDQAEPAAFPAFAQSQS